MGGDLLAHAPVTVQQVLHAWRAVMADPDRVVLHWSHPYETASGDDANSFEEAERACAIGACEFACVDLGFKHSGDMLVADAAAMALRDVDRACVVNAFIDFRDSGREAVIAAIDRAIRANAAHAEAPA